MNEKLLEYFTSWAENGVNLSISEGRYPKAEIELMEDEFKTLRGLLETKFREMDEINDIFNSIITAAKVLNAWQYYELDITDIENDETYKVYLVNKETIEKMKELKLLNAK